MKRRVEYVRSICLCFLTVVFLFVTWLPIERSKWGYVAVYFACSIISAMWFAASVIRWKMDERFDRLEELLKQNCKKEEEKESKQ